MKKNKKFKKRYILIGFIIAAGIGVFAFRSYKTTTYLEYVVSKQDVSDELLLAGTIDAPGRVDLGFAVGGRVDKIFFKTGERVKKGQVIAQVSQSGLTSSLIQARANYTLSEVDTASSAKNANRSYESIKVEQDILVENFYQQYISGDIQAYNLSSNDKENTPPLVTGTYNSDIKGVYNISMYGSSSSSGYSYRLSGLESGTYTALVNQPDSLGSKGLYVQFSSNSRYNDTDWSIEIPNKRSLTYLARKTAYENSLSTRDRILAEALNNLDSVTLLQGDTGLSRNQAQRNQAQAQIDAVYTQLDDGKITAPFDGIVARNDLEKGEIVSAFTSVIVVFQDDEKQLDLNVPEIYINKITIGDIVKITLDAYQDIEFLGEISFIDLIDTRVDGVPVYKAEIKLDQKDERIRVGMNAKASIVSKKKEQVIAIPQHYLRINTIEETVVDVKIIESSDEIQERVVVVGLKGNEGLVEIISGLDVGEKIVTSEELK